MAGLAADAAGPRDPGGAADASERAAGPPAPFLFPLCWFVTGFVFFSLSTGKRGAYLLPLYPAAALLVGWVWARTITEGRGSRWIGMPVALLAGVALRIALGILLVPRRLIPGRMVDTLVPADPAWQVAAAVIAARRRGGDLAHVAARPARRDARRDRRRAGALPPRRRARPGAPVRGPVPGA